MKRPNDALTVVLVSAEASPFVAEGPAARTAFALTAALSLRGVRASLVLPKYHLPGIEALPLVPTVRDMPVPLGSDAVKASVFEAGVRADGRGEAESAPISVYFVDNAKYFGRDRVFGSPQADYLDNDARFTFFARAVPEFLIKAKIDADVIHCLDWPTALVPLFLKTHYARRKRFRKTVSVFTLHDPDVRGAFPPESLALTGLNWDFFTPECLALNGKLSFLKAGLLFADAVGAGSEACAAAVREGRANGAPAVISGPDADDPEAWAPAADLYLELYRRTIDSRKGGRHVR